MLFQIQTTVCLFQKVVSHFIGVNRATFPAISGTVLVRTEPIILRKILENGSTAD